MNKILAAAVAVLAFSASAGNFTQHVNPFIGTGAIDGGLCGNNYPAATVPFGMIQLGPDTHPSPDWYNASGYSYNDGDIHGFTHTRLSGTGAADLIDICLFPSTTSATYSNYSHDKETAKPGYYSVDLLAEGIKAEMTATPRVGLHRYTFPDGAQTPSVLIDLDRSCQKGSWGRQIIQSQIRMISPTRIVGYRVITGWAKLRKVYFAMELNQPVKDFELYSGGNLVKGADLANGNNLKAWLHFAPTSKPIIAKVALSGVSIANAEENLKAEAPDFNFDTYVANADKNWDDILGKIEVEGTPEQMETFYTALYHTMIQPNIFNDVNGQYMAPDYSTRQLPKGENQYTTFSLWDTYRAAHPLYTILLPEITADFVNSMIRHYEDYGYLPIWHLWGQDNYCMIGNHAIPVVVDAVLKGIPGIDAEKAYEAVKGSSLQPHPGSPWEVYERLGYMPENIQSQSVSITMEDSFDDWCVAQLAQKLGKQNDYAHFMKRSENYRNLFDPSVGFFRGKDDQGNWVEFDALRHGANGGWPYTEGNAWQYYWYVPQNIPALVELTGGKKAFEKKLDDFFSITETSGEKNSNISGSIGQYAHGNEPSHHVAYLYNDADAPRKAQEMVNRICNDLYNTTSSGYAGNDDCGEMSAWYIFSSLGFYPVNPDAAEYYIGTPQFDKATIHLPNGNDFTITAKRSKPGQYAVKNVALDGKKITDYKLSHGDLLNGGNLHFNITK